MDWGATLMSKLVVEILTEWDIVAARQLGSNEAKEIGFSAVEQAEIATAISELARNIYLYAQAGEIVIERIIEDGKMGIWIIATDKGQISSELGMGLPGVKRLMDNLEIQSEAGQGTFIKAEK